MHAAQPTPFFWFPFFQYISAMPFQGMFDYRPKSEKNNNNNSRSGNNKTVRVSNKWKKRQEKGKLKERGYKAAWLAGRWVYA